MPVSPARQVVVMGVSGSGKSTVARLLAERLGWKFLEGDAFHPPRNVSRMAAGIPLTDDDRRGWLLAIAEQLADAQRAGRGVVASCSALKRSYRELLRGESTPLAFVHLDSARSLLEERLSVRVAHFMPASLLTSQLQTLEPPGSDENAITFDAALPPDDIAARAALWLGTP